jgi:hypothetical protein
MTELWPKRDIVTIDLDACTKVSVLLEGSKKMTYSLWAVSSMLEMCDRAHQLCEHADTHKLV